jgi:Condensation domain
MRLARLGPGRHVLLIVSHHIVFDGWSRDILVRDLATAYRALAAGEPAPLADHPVQFADYAVWQHEHYSGEVLDEHLAFWRRELSGPLEPLELRPDTAGTQPTFRSRDLDYQLSPELASAVRRFAREEGATLFMTLLAAFKALLHLRTGARDVRVATLVSNRDWPSTHDLVGLFANVLVLRSEIAGGDSFRDLVHRVREGAISAYAHQGLPFETLLADLDRGGAVDRRGLLQIGFALHVASLPRIDLGGGVELELLRELAQGEEGEELNPSTFDLTLELVEVGELLHGRIEYARNVFDEPAIARLADDFQLLLERAVAAPDLPIETLRPAA